MTAGVFSPAGDRILLTGPRPYFFTYDLQGGQMVKSMRGLWNEGLGGTDTETSHSGGLHHARYSPDGSLIAIAGRRGYVHLLDARNPGSGQVVGQLRVPNGQLAGLTWSADGTTITTASKEAEVYVWDVRSQSCVSRWRDEGGFGTCKIEADASGQYLAIGWVRLTGIIFVLPGSLTHSSTTGIVNVYDGASHPTAGPPNALGAFPERKPLKAVMNLTTAVSSMRFNHDASILALASDQKKDQLKLVRRAHGVLRSYEELKSSTHRSIARA
jgi:U3 small nucleolar RNA-associated protein 18